MRSTGIDGASPMGARAASTAGARAASPAGSRAASPAASPAASTARLAFLATVGVILLVKAVTLESLPDHVLWGAYSVLVTTYILSRFVLAAFNRPPPAAATDAAYTPTVTFIIPAKNEEKVIAKTLRRCLQVDYPRDRVQVVAIDDGSEDGTLAEMRRVQAEYPELTVLHWRPCRGKRHAQAEAFRQSDGEIVIFVDSDSLIEPDAPRRIVRYFLDPKVGAVSGHADVYNKETNLLTRMQAVRYYVAFRVYKSAESLYDSVTCCSGCFSAYRRSALRRVLPAWLNQSFLGVPSTYGDDRSLTNFLLPDYKIVYAPDARCQTVVPESWAQFFRQQLRWKRSWVRESLRAATFMWRKPPVMAASFYAGLLLPLMAPLVVFRALLYNPLAAGIPPYVYLSGILLMALLYGLYYRIHNANNLWLYGTLFPLLYAAVLVWQLPYAALTLRDNRWGTR